MTAITCLGPGPHYGRADGYLGDGLTGTVASCGAVTCAPTYVPTVDRVNADALRVKLQNALTANAAYLALVTPTNADVVAQVRLLTRECNGIMRMVGNWLDTTTGT